MSGSLKETITSLILDFQDIQLATGTPRQLKIATIHGKASVCIGVRRSGKSTFLFQVIQRLLESGVPRENILYLHFFDDRLHQLNAGSLGLITEAYYILHPKKKQTETVYCFFDEIQAVSGWEPFVDRLLRTEKCEIFLTGSSARMLSTEVATQMRGRALSWELFPFSFREFLAFQGIDNTGPFSTTMQMRIQKSFKEYWESGGFPEVMGIDRQLRIKIHQEYFHAVLYRDLIERHDSPHPKAVIDLAHWLIDNCASLYSISRLAGYLKSLGHKVPRSAVTDYLAWFEDAFFIFSVRLFDASLARANANPKKCYCIDHAMILSVASGILVNAGHLLENMVFNALRRITPTISYYKTNNGKEVDFIVQRNDKSWMLIQSCVSLADPQTYKREVTALADAMAEQGITEGTIVTQSEEMMISVDAGIIHVVTIWKFLLDLPTK